MNVLTLQQQVRDYAISIGIDKIGFTSAAPFIDLKRLLKQQQELGYQSGFEEADITKRTEPTLLLEQAQSIIAIAVAYPSKMVDAPQGKKGERRGIFCRASWGIDYHTAMRERLALLEQFILEKVPTAKLRSMVDTGELSDRAVAERAGIGWSGKNTNIITPEFGSYVYLAEMITNIPFESDEAIGDQCEDCRLCLDVCPTGALIQGGQLNAQRCIAFLTQTKGDLPDEFRTHLGNRIYGCDTCQTVCPKNKRKHNLIHEELFPDPEIAKPLLKPLLTISNKDFKQQFGHISGAWRGKKPLQRNAIYALAHFKEEEAIPLLEEVMTTDERPVIKGAAAWAIGKINGEQSKAILQRALIDEQDAYVIEEIHKGLLFTQ
ncbi:tRNA epoxyqueuosine(34) reductase QueG [Kurthia sibirica]|uniref:tRNA epoxyqueuosine(34) reductase QueG n=1 Tax=Kurthia sibirica TaxID=202750 RepID=A0A2U3AH71_9BACL|nr:tRNA epoxyqueuosine(34) reductase QueG [Kurthia sibirica]PWI23898.1 tRNA epoxyqueuosine(34) reductase QueG [Kurthia sibirica]GEK34916.1 epoxyqueuosine reductase [Kurthia sibirica]